MANLLVLTPRYPFPLHSGDKIRIYHLCRMLARQHRLTLLSLCESAEEQAHEPPAEIFARVERVHLPRWRSWLNAALALPTSRPLQLAYYQSRVFAQTVRELAPQHDLVLAHLIRMGQYAETLDLPRILEMTDALSMTYQRVRDQRDRVGLKSWLYRIEAARVRQCETRMACRFDLTTLVSPVDAAYLNDHLGALHRRAEATVEVYGNGVDTRAFYDVGPRPSPVAVFVGNMRTAQNQDACRYFVRDVLPRIRKTIPAFRLRIVGASPPDVAASFRGPHVDVLGRVDSIPEAVRGAFCGVCPMRLGAGVQNKVLEYMAMGLPTVVTQVGHEGLEARDGEQLLVASSPEAFADAVVRLYEAPGQRARMGEAARAFVTQHYTWEQRLTPFVEAVNALLPHRARPSPSVGASPSRPYAPDVYVEE